MAIDAGVEHIARRQYAQEHPGQEPTSEELEKMSGKVRDQLSGALRESMKITPETSSLDTLIRSLAGPLVTGSAALVNTVISPNVKPTEAPAAPTQDTKPTEAPAAAPTMGSWLLDQADRLYSRVTGASPSEATVTQNKINNTVNSGNQTTVMSGVASPRDSQSSVLRRIDRDWATQ